MTLCRMILSRCPTDAAAGNGRVGRSRGVQESGHVCTGSFECMYST